jgi:hypothetical protein
MCFQRFLAVSMVSVTLVLRPAISAAGLHDRSRVMRSALCFHICYSMGRRCASMSSVALDVALYRARIPDARRRLTRGIGLNHHQQT